MVSCSAAELNPSLMLSFLKNHPFPVEAFFESSLVLTLAAPKEVLAPLLPARLELDTFQDRWGFLAVAMVQTSGLRPKGFPAFLGSDFFLVGYRVFVRYHTLAKKRWRGLYILRSETDRKRMEFLGNVFTHYRYATIDLERSIINDEEQIQSRQSNFNIIIDRSTDDAQLPPNSPFSSWKEARRFAGPLPFTFSCDESKGTVLIVEGVRKNWAPKPVQVKAYRFGFVEQLGLEGLCLANAFEIRQVPYFWKKGKIEQWL